jgi:hypothetical protein
MMMEIDYMMQAKGVIMNNFTKDYIDLCKNEKVQGLKEFLSEGDYCVDIDKECWFLELITDVEWKRIENRIWLPQEHDLDREIRKICIKNKSDYQIVHNDVGITHCWINPNCINLQATDTNPLIAKLKLLISLLKEE